MNPFDPSQDTPWYRFVDGVVILILGVVLGIFISQALAFFEMETITTGSQQTPVLESPGNDFIKTPTGTLRIDEI